jgi:predicted peptidase
MDTKYLLLIAVGVGFLAGCDNTQKHSTRPEGLTQRAAVLSREVLVELDYLIYLPQEYGAKDKTWPLMVFLHGAGERGDDLNKVKVHGPPKLIEQGKDFPFIVVSPQCPADNWWPNMIGHVIALIDEMAENYSIDKNRIYLTGMSMGGYGTWTVASAYPQRFAAIAPVCGGGQPYLAGNLKDIPVWAFHGAKDSVVPLELSQQMVNAVKGVGGNAKLTVYPEAGHDSWTETYNNNELYGWLLSHSKKQD